MKAMIGFLAIALMSLPVTALTVIYDSGNTLPLSNYVNRQTKPKTQPLISGTANFSVLPVRTPSMHPGRVESRKITFPYLQLPLFIVGSDDLSKRWLQENRAQLKALQAVGMLVQAETERDLNDIKAIADGLWISPASGESIAASLDLHRYPVLISKTGIEQ